MLKRKTKKLYCCERCKNYWTCETKWYRGEHGKENLCCALCVHYDACLKAAPAAKQKKKK